MIETILKYQFLQKAILASILTSIVAGIIGVIIVQKKLVMMTGGIAHTTYGGVGLGYLLGIEPILGGFMFALGAAFGIGYLKRKGGVDTDILIALFWSLGMAAGVAFIGLMPGYPPDITSYLFGNILSVTNFDLIMMAVLTVVVTLSTLIFLNDWKTYLFDEEFAHVRGMKTSLMEYWLLVLVALTVVVLIRAAGIMLVISMLTAPAASARQISKKFSVNIILAVVLGAVYCLIGLGLSYVLNIASGATIIAVSVLGFALCMVLSKILKNKKTVKN
ncbi:MAG TPA: metal ABC transporter permease [Eubacteriales bacterium]|nr:metal ABC transporter permease [Eubacteriales bacterium]